jgi:hypothetical protein
MTRRRPLLLAPLLAPLVAGCVPLTRPVPFVPVPTSLRLGLGDPAVAAINLLNDAFSRPGRLAGRPAEAADAIAQIEWLVTDIATDQRWFAMSPLVLPALRAGRDEIRQAFGIAADATPAEVVTGFDGAAEGLRDFDVSVAGDALEPLVGRDRIGPALEMLSNLPPLPLAARGAATAQRGLFEMNRRGTVSDGDSD